MKHSPLETTFWQFSNIVPIAISIIMTIIGAVIAYETTTTDMNRRIDRLEQKVDFLVQSFQEFKNGQLSKASRMETYVIDLEKMKDCYGKVCK